MKQYPLYHHTPLQRRNNIRLLNLLPLTDATYSAFDASRHVIIKLSEQVIDNRLQFEALSYTWANADGDNSLRERVFCNGHTLPVTINCKAALHRLRLPDSPRLLWVDAICINQNDKKEKSEQIPLMRDIYSSAERVVVWLGEGDPKCDRAFGYLRAFAEEIRQAIERGLNVAEQTVHKQLKRLSESSEPSTPGDAIVKEAISVVFRKTYWTRVWVIQEVCLGQETILVCGDSSISFGDLDIFHTCLAVHKPLGLFNDVYDFGINTVTLIRGSFRTAFPMTTVHGSNKGLGYLRCARRSGASDKRDYVHGIRGLLPEQDRCFPDPAIGQTVAELYTETARAILKSTSDLEILQDVSGISDISGLPGWVPDWSIGDLNSFPEAPHSCSGNSQAVIDWTGDRSHLKVKGSIVRSLAILCDSAGFARQSTKSEDAYDAYAQDSIRVWGDWLKCALSRKEKSPVENWEAFWRSLCWNSQDKDALQPDEKWAASAAAWREIIETRSGGMNLDDTVQALESDVRAGLYQTRVILSTMEKKFATTASNDFALVPEYARTGDLIAVLAGGKLPHVLRKSEKGDNEYTYVGCCYVHEIMHGELWEGDGKLQWLILDEKAPT